jgi:drug/metabolite transporter (DMT)-like permease
VVSGAQAELPNDRLKGIACMLGAVGAFACMDTLLKSLAGHYEPMQVSAMRGFASLPFMLLPVLITRRFSDLKPIRWKMHLFRGILAVFVLGTFIYAIRTLSLADAYAIFLSAPLIVTALSVPILRERVGWHRWLAIIIGLCGVLVMLRPSASGLASIGALAALVSAIAYAVSGIVIRVLTKTDTNISVIFWSMLIMTLVSTALALNGWKEVHVDHFSWIVATGAIGAVALYLITVAFRSAPIAVIAPFEYTALLWGVGIDWVIWDTLPEGRFYIGATIVIASGLYVIWRESRVKHEPAMEWEQAR